MKTRLIKADSDAIQEAADLLTKGELVAFPTETVYGLGANGLDEAAVAKIFLAKGRPQDNPLILHIAKREQLAELVEAIPEKATRLMDAFWPGPLTLIFRAKPTVAPNVTAGGGTVGIRMPSHPVAQALLEACALPVAAPSANVSGRPSPTDAHTVFEDLSGKVPMILDGGDTQIGLESTVLDITVDPPVILRPGFVTAEDMAPVVGYVKLDPHLVGDTAIPKSPGQKYRHYAPRAKVSLYDSVDQMREERAQAEERGEMAVLLLFMEDAKCDSERAFSLGSASDLSQMAHLLYRRLREADDACADRILVQAVERKGWGFAIMNRLEKAAGEVAR